MTETKLQPQALNDNPMLDGIYRQAIMNGNFDIWQRGTSFTASGYTADRWRMNMVGSSMTTSQQNFTVGQTDVPNEPEYYLRNVVTSVTGSGNYAIVTQRIESVRTFAGQTATLSFWAKADAAKNIAIEFVQNFGSGGSPSTKVTGIESQLVALTTSWAKYTVTVSIPSISGKTLGSTDDGFLELYIWFDAGSGYASRSASLGQQSGTFDIAQVQLNAGSVALPFQPKSYADELRACQRYYQEIYVRSFVAVIYVPNGDTRINNIYYPVPMRTTPSVSPNSFTKHSINFSYDGSMANSPTVTWNVHSGNGYIYFASSTGGDDYGGTDHMVVLGSHCDTTFSLDAEL